MKESETAVLGNELSFPRKKKSKNSDRISELPDAVLCHILSFIPFNRSVQTSILSKRWLHLWTHLPVVEMDDSMLSYKTVLFTEQSAHTSFINFMRNVLGRCHTDPIDKFILKCSKFDVFHVSQWITAAAKRKVRELDLCIRTEKVFKISCSVFAYKEMVTLKLGENFDLVAPSSLLFPSLRKLHLNLNDFDDGTIHDFLSGCPVLEDLDIYCSTKKWDTLVINAPALKFFTISSFCVDKDGNDLPEGHEFKFILETPNLQVLKYTGPQASRGFCFRDLNSLVKAEMDIFSTGDVTNYEIEMVRGIVNAKTISLSENTLQIISDINVDDLPIFHNLTELQLGVGEHCSGKLLSRLLHNSPNLEVLVFDWELAKYGGNFKWEQPESVPKCFSRYLEVVDILGFDGEEWVGEFLKYVLHNGKVLKECSDSRDKTELEEVKVSKKLLKYLTK